MFKWLTAGFISSLALILLFAFTDYLPAPHPIAASLFNAAVNLAYGYCASYIFYIINYYLPNKRQRDKCYDDIARCLAHCDHNFKRLEKTFDLTIASEESPKYTPEMIIPMHENPIAIFMSYGHKFYGGQIDLSMAILFVMRDTATLINNAILLSTHLTGIEKLCLIAVLDDIPSEYKHCGAETFPKNRHVDFPPMRAIELSTVKAACDQLNNHPNFPKGIIQRKNKFHEEINESVTIAITEYSRPFSQNFNSSAA